MDLTGTWKPYGKYVKKDQGITISGQELTFWFGTASLEPGQATVHFHLEEEHCLRENHCHNIKIDDEQYKNMDYMVHEETIEGKQVVILSCMTMEYDGRGRIVISSYVREEDYGLINDEFESLAYKYWNNRPSVPMMQMNPGIDISMGILPGMMPEMFPGMMPGMTPETTAAVPSKITPVEPWDCSCGNKHITTRFCGECGMPNHP